MGVSVGQNYLYVLANGLSQIVGYRVGPDGAVDEDPIIRGAA